MTFTTDLAGLWVKTRSNRAERSDQTGPSRLIGRITARSRLPAGFPTCRRAPPLSTASPTCRRAPPLAGGLPPLSTASPTFPPVGPLSGPRCGPNHGKVAEGRPGRSGCSGSPYRGPGSAPVRQPALPDQPRSVSRPGAQHPRDRPAPPRPPTFPPVGPLSGPRSGPNYVKVAEGRPGRSGCSGSPYGGPGSAPVRQPAAPDPRRPASPPGAPHDRPAPPRPPSTPATAQHPRDLPLFRR